MTTSTAPGRLQVSVQGIGLLGPGLADWATGQALLDNPQDWLWQPTEISPPQRLPANERRRAGSVVKASIVVADQACTMAGLEAAALASVFTSSTGDPLNCHLLCEALASPERSVSPTRFTNSVHNAAAGYWHIAAQSRQPSTSLAAFDASFAAGLLEAAVQCVSSQSPVLLVACDVPYPEPLHRVRPLLDVFALALVLAPDSAHQRTPAGADPRCSGPRLSLQCVPLRPAIPCAHAGLERLRLGVPAARALPLLQVLARGPGGGGSQVLPSTRLVLEGWPGMALQVDIEPDA